MSDIELENTTLVIGYISLPFTLVYGFILSYMSSHRVLEEI